MKMEGHEQQTEETMRNAISLSLALGRRVSRQRDRLLSEVSVGQANLDHATALRRRAFQRAHESGLSWIEIGKSAGISANAARRLVKRDEGE